MCVVLSIMLRKNILFKENRIMAGSGFKYETRRKIQVIAAKMFPYSFIDKIYTKIICGYFPNLKNPKTFNEKVQWLKLYYYTRDNRASDMADKVKVRDILKKKGLSNILPKLLFVCDKIEEIPWDSLPDKFVIKCNHGCAYNIICEDKSKFDRKSAEKKLKRWMNEDFGLFNIEPHYSLIERKIFCEEYLGEKLLDYKFFCFNGEPQFLYVSRDLTHDSIAEMSYYDMKWKKISLVRDDYKDLSDIEKPQCFDELVQLSRMLSSEFPFVRVDFYVINNKPIFSEMTFTPSAGMMPITPRHFDADWGELLDIKKLL